MRGVSKAVAAVLGSALLAGPAAANEHYFEFWSNPSVEIEADADTAFELETAQRLRARRWRPRYLFCASLD